MAVDLNHTIVPCRDKLASARFLAGLLDLEVQQEWGGFIPVQTANGVTLYYMEAEDFRPIHYCFLVGDEEFDAILARVAGRGLTYWADPGHRKEGEINHLFGGRGFYFDDPDGHNLEVITAPYSQ
ncbi:VOC family protein [Thermoactinospora rubra]|uniref:VOC family protein n=1 Tax=Thermoactinospora rubra TaxID=1088767 RepID=UPI000A10B518|nr:VOC family protein [Thermoactinospora rubra]